MRTFKNRRDFEKKVFKTLNRTDISIEKKIDILWNMRCEDDSNFNRRIKVIFKHFPGEHFLFYGNPGRFYIEEITQGWRPEMFGLGEITKEITFEIN